MGVEQGHGTGTIEALRDKGYKSYIRTTETGKGAILWAAGLRGNGCVWWGRGNPG